MDSRRVLRALRRWSWMIALFAIISSATAYAISLQLPTVYETQALALVNPGPVAGASTQGTANDVVVQTYVDLIDSSPVDRRLVADGVPRSAGDIAKEITVKRQIDTSLIIITVHDRDPQVALRMAQDIIPEFNNSLAELQQRVLGPAQPQLVALVSWEVPTAAPFAPISPKPRQNAVFAAFGGLILGIGLALLLEYLDNTIKSEYDIRLRLNLPLLGMVVAKKRSRNKVLDGPDLVTLREPKDPMSEAYRAMRTNLMFSGVDNPLRTLVVTSSIPSEGKTTTASNLAVTLAQAGNRVVLVDADFRRPQLHKVFGLTENIGLGNLILGDRSEEDVLTPTEIPNLMIVCTGPVPPNPSELLGSESMARITNRFRAKADIVIFDTPPIGAVTDATVLAATADGVVLVVERGRTPIPAVIRARETLESVQANILGVILNKVRAAEATGYGYYYYYAETPEPKKKGARTRQLGTDVAAAISKPRSLRKPTEEKAADG